MAAMTIFHRRNINLFKTIIIQLPKYRFCSTGGSDVDEANENISDGPGTESHGKKLDLVVACLRVDRVTASGFGMGRSKIKDFITSKDVYVNKLNTSKSALVNEGDEIDLTRSKEDDKVVMSRFKVLTIDKDLTKKAKRRLSGIRYGSMIVSRKEFDKSYAQSSE